MRRVAIDPGTLISDDVSHRILVIMEVEPMTAVQQRDNHTPIVRARVPAFLKAAALQALGDPNASDTALIRAALASLAGLPVDKHAAPLPRYRRNSGTARPA